jgi:hypothetical protein
MKRLLFGLALFASILIPGSGALAGPPNFGVVTECYLANGDKYVDVVFAPANEMPVAQARANLDTYLEKHDTACIAGTLERLVRPAGN